MADAAQLVIAVECPVSFVSLWWTENCLGRVLSQYHDTSIDSLTIGGSRASSKFQAFTFNKLPDVCALTIDQARQVPNPRPTTCEA